MWSRDGRELIYREESRIYAAPIHASPFRSGTPTLLFEAPFAPNDLARFDVTADGQFLLVAQDYNPPRDIAAVLNWFEELCSAWRVYLSCCRRMAFTTCPLQSVVRHRWHRGAATLYCKVETYNGSRMAEVLVSQKGWVVIPVELRKKYHWKPGDRVKVVDYGGVISLVPVLRDPETEAVGALRTGQRSLVKALRHTRREERRREQSRK